MNVQMPPASRMHGTRSATGDYQKVMRLYQAAMDRMDELEARIVELESRPRPGRPKKKAEAK